MASAQRPRPKAQRPQPDAAVERVHAANRLTLDATLAAREDLRFTPAGLPALSMTLMHTSQQPEAGGTRRVECEISAIAFGGVAQAIARLPVNTALRCEGFLARRYRTGTTLALHVDRFELTTST